MSSHQSTAAPHAARMGTVIFAACLAAAHPGHALTLHEAQEILHRDNPDLAIARLEMKRAEAQVDEARAAWLPSVDALGNYAYTTEVSRLKFAVPLPGGGTIPLNRELGDHDRVELGVDASMPLFTGFSRGRNVAARRAQSRSREAQWRAAKNQMSLRLAALFYAWQLSHLQAAYQAKVLEHSREFQKQLQDFVKAGTAVRSRALAAEARAAAAEVDLLAAQNTRDSLAFEVLDFMGRRGAPGGSPGPGNASDTLGRNAAGLGTPEDLSLDTARLPAPDWENPPVTGAVQPEAGRSQPEAGKSRPEAEALDQGMAQARLGQKALQGQKLPQLFGTAGYRYANPGLNQTEDEFMGYGLVGLQLRWNLFDGSRNRSQRKQLDVQARILEEQRRKLEGEWWKAMQSTRLQYARWAAQFEAARSARDAARASTSDIKRQMDAGLSTGLEWLDARNQEARAEMTMEQARTLQRLSLLQWRYAAGKELRF